MFQDLDTWTLPVTISWLWSSYNIFFYTKSLKRNTHWQPHGECASRKTALHWRLLRESASGKVFCPAKGSIRMAIRKSILIQTRTCCFYQAKWSRSMAIRNIIPRTKPKPHALYILGWDNKEHFIRTFIYVCRYIYMGHSVNKVIHHLLHLQMGTHTW